MEDDRHEARFCQGGQIYDIDRANDADCKHSTTRQWRDMQTFEAGYCLARSETVCYRNLLLHGLLRFTTAFLLLCVVQNVLA